VVAPTARDVEVSLEEPLFAEAQLGEHLDAGLVLRPDGGLQPVQPAFAEAMVDDERGGPGRDAAADGVGATGR